MQIPRILPSILCLLVALSACAESHPPGQPTSAPTVQVQVAGKQITASPVNPAITRTAVPTPSSTLSPTPSPTPFLAAPAPGKPAEIPVLMYHHIEPLESFAPLSQRTWTVSPDSLSQQLDYLQSKGFHTVTFPQLIAFFDRGQPLPTRPIILTFDDGWMDAYTVAFPALKARAMTGVFFIPITYADAGGKALVGWTQLQEMSSAGMEIGSHTLNHANLTQSSSGEAWRQLSASKQKIEAKLGRPVISLSYPFGAYNSQVIALAGQAGYEAAVGLCCGYQLRSDILLTLPRIRVDYDETLDDFIKKLPPSETNKSTDGS